MDDIEMNNINNINEDKTGDDSFAALNNIQQQLTLINTTFHNTLDYIRNFSPLIEKGEEKNLEKESNDLNQIGNYEQNKQNFEQNLEKMSEEMNAHFDKIVEMTKNLKNFEEFNMTEKQLIERLNKLKENNKLANEEMNKKLKNIENIFNELNADNSMKNELNNRFDSDFNLDI